MKQPFYRSRGFQYGAASLVLLVVLGALWWNSLKALFLPFIGQGAFDGEFVGALLSLGFAVVTVTVTRDLFSRLVSQFALPVNTPEERRQAGEHFLRYSSGKPGAALFVRDGQMVGGAAERHSLRAAAGVILVDSVSGVVLRTDTQLTRACGPGVVFTRPGEYIAEVLDLRRQTRRLENVRALTRDGIDLTVDISVSFMLDSGERTPLENLPNPALPPYVFNEDSALKAAYGKTYRDKTLSEWAELPALLAADVWRDRLIQRDFESLFSSSDTGLPLLEGLRAEVQSRLTGTGPGENAREAKVLAERGLRVLNVSLANLVLPEEVQRKRLENWKEDWKSQAGEIPDDKDPVIKAWRQHGQVEARIQLLDRFTRFTREQLAAGRQPPAVDVVLSLATAARHLLNDPALQGHPSLADLRGQIESLEIWAQRLASGSRPASGR